MSLTNIETSNLSPHLKNFVDDIISITSNLILKRNDIANDYEDSWSSTMAEYYKQIVEGTDTIDLYEDIPYSIFSSLISWQPITYEKERYFPRYIPYGPSEISMYESNGTCYIGSQNPTLDSNFKDIGNKNDGYVSIKSSKLELMDFFYYDDNTGWFMNILDDLTLPEDQRYELLKRIIVTSDTDELSYGQYRFSDLFARYEDEFTPVKNIPNRYTKTDNGFIYDQYGFYEYVVDYDRYMKFETFTDEEISNMMKTKQIPSQYQEEILEKMRSYVIENYVNPDLSPSKDFVVKRYFGERNQYYRELNGLPPIDRMSNQPIINMNELLPNEYPNSSVSKRLYNLTDEEVEAIKLNGKYDELFTIYSSIDYLKHMGRNRIDVLEARNTDNFEILKIGTYSEKYHYNIFIENFRIAKEYILRRFFFPELYGNHKYYGDFISYLITVQAMCQSIARSDSILLNHLYTDEDTIRLRLESFGLNVFNDIPLIYRKNIAKNIENLIINKGINSIYKLILDIFNVDSVEVYRYFYRQLLKDGQINLTMSQVPIDAEKFINEILKDINKTDYDEITKNDIYWASYGMPLTYKNPETGNIESVGDPNDYLKNKILETRFNYMNSKYISINGIFNLSKLNFNASYLMNYLLELSKRNLSIEMDVDGIDERQSLFMIMVLLFAIQAKRLGYDGNIQHDASSVAYVLKYNLDQTVQKDGETISILDLYKQYSDPYYKYQIEKYTGKSISNIIKNGDDISEIKTSVDSLSDDKKSEDISLEIPADISIDSISESYLYNSGINGAYNKIIELRENASTYKEYECYNELLKAIAISKLNNTIFKLTYPGWVKIDDPDNCIMWNEVTDETLKEDIYNNYINGNIGINENYIICKSDGYPELSLGKKYSESIQQYCVDSSTVGSLYDSSVKIYVKEPILKDMSSDKLIGNGNIVYYKEDISETVDIDFTDYPEPYCFIKGSDGNDDLLIKYLRYARTYQEYLYYENSDLYDLIQPTEDEYETDDNGQTIISADYYSRLGELYMNIVVGLENLIKNEELNNLIQTSFTDLNLLTDYIKKVVNVFKSFEIDIATINIIYEINNPNRYRVKIIDEFSSESEETQYDHFHIIQNLSFNEYTNQLDGFTIRDELNIEEIKKEVI